MEALFLNVAMYIVYTVFTEELVFCHHTQIKGMQLTQELQLCDFSPVF